MKKTIQLEQDKLFVVGETYLTKMATRWKFKLTRDPYRRTAEGIIYGMHSQFFGIYEDSPHLGECPIGIDRLYPHKELVDKEIDVCECCGRPL